MCKSESSASKGARRNELVKQDCFIVNKTVVCTLAPEACYHLSGMMVRTFGGRKSPKENFKIECITDIGEVESLIEPEEKRCVEDAVVIGVKYIDVYKWVLLMPREV